MSFVRAFALLGLALATLPVAESKTLLAMGDSICTGQLPEPRNTVFVSNFSYTDRLYVNLNETRHFTGLVKICCPSEDSSEFINGTFAQPPSDGSFCYGRNPELLGSQLATAVQLIQQDQEEVGLVTISMGANDLFPCVIDAGIDQACGNTRIAQAVANMEAIVKALQESFGGGNVPPIIAMPPYNPFLAHFLGTTSEDEAIATESQELLRNMTAALVQQVYSPLGVAVVDGLEVLEGPNEICRYTGMCVNSTATGSYVLADEAFRDIHPNAEGYQKLADAHISLLEASEDPSGASSFKFCNFCMVLLCALALIRS